jgi:hypothetical protein
MKRIRKEDIAGARITAIHALGEELPAEGEGGVDCTSTRVFFTVDRGFTFTLPRPGRRWFSEALPPGAEAMPDESVEEWYRIVTDRSSRMEFVPGEPRKIDVVRRIKARTIAGVFCDKEDEAPGYDISEDAFLVLDDGSQVSCLAVAPKGIGTGLCYETDAGEIPGPEARVDFFAIPVEDDSGGSAGART